METEPGGTIDSIGGESLGGVSKPEGTDRAARRKSRADAFARERAERAASRLVTERQTRAYRKHSPRLTLGLFLFVLNGLCLWLTASLVKGFEVHGFWAAVFGAILVSVVSWLLTTAVSDRGQIVVITRWRGDGLGSIR